MFRNEKEISYKVIQFLIVLHFNEEFSNNSRNVFKNFKNHDRIDYIINKKG